MEKSYQNWENLIQIIQASTKNPLQTQFGNLAVILQTGINAIYYSLFKSKAKEQGEQFLMDENSTLFCKLWNLPKNPYVKFWYSKMLPQVELHQVIYVPKTLKELNTEDLRMHKFEKTISVSPHYLTKKPENYREYFSITICIENM